VAATRMIRRAVMGGAYPRDAAPATIYGSEAAMVRMHSKACVAVVPLGLLAALGCGSSSKSPSDTADSGSGGTREDSGHAGGGGGGDASPPDGSQENDGGGPSDSAAAEGAPSEGGSSPSGAWVMGYYPAWDDPSNGGNYPVTAIDWDGISHVFTAFYVPDGNGGFMSGEFTSTSAGAVISAAHAHGKKAVASIGGADSGAGFEGSMQTAQATFLTNLQGLITMGYDGIDIDWEGGNLTTAQDQALETTLIDSLRTKNPSIILTMTAGYENENSLDDLSFYGTISSKLDRINLMTYAMAGAWSGWESWHSSPLHWNKNSSTPTGIDSSAAHYIAAGVPAAKLGVGAGFYGSCWTAPVTGPVQTLGGSTIPASDGVMSYTNIMASYYSSAAYHYDTSAEAPYLDLSGQHNAQGCTFVSYEDATSLAAKIAWMKSEKLGGLIIWTISEGFISAGATVADQNPLLEVTKTAL
jgi:chitinase